MTSFNYTTIAGETWGSISYKMYGSVAGIVNLVEANPYVPVDAVFAAGIKRIIPILENYTVTTSNTPPWK